MTTEDALPALPEPTIKPYYPPAGFQHYPPATAQATVEVAFPQAWYTGAQMRAYALAALTLVQAERDAARQERDTFREAALSGVAALQDMQQERDELRALLQAVWDDVSSIDTDACLSPEVGRRLKAVLTPKATQPTSERCESPDLGINGSRCGTHGTSGS